MVDLWPCLSLSKNIIGQPGKLRAGATPVTNRCVADAFGKIDRWEFPTMLVSPELTFH